MSTPLRPSHLGGPEKQMTFDDTTCNQILYHLNILGATMNSANMVVQNFATHAASILSGSDTGEDKGYYLICQKIVADLKSLSEKDKETILRIIFPNGADTQNEQMNDYQKNLLNGFLMLSSKGYKIENHNLFDKKTSTLKKVSIRTHLNQCRVLLGLLSIFPKPEPRGPEKSVCPPKNPEPVKSRKPSAFHRDMTIAAEKLRRENSTNNE